MDKAYLLMSGVFAVAVATGAAFPKSRLAVVIPLLLPIAITAIPILRDPKAGEAFLFVAPFLVAILIVYGFISFGGVAVGRWLRRRIGGTGAQDDAEA
jgi:hypothetical protein